MEMFSRQFDVWISNSTTDVAQRRGSDVFSLWITVEALMVGINQGEWYSARRGPVSLWCMVRDYESSGLQRRSAVDK